MNPSLVEVLLVVLAHLAHDDAAKLGVVDVAVHLDLVDEVLDFGLGRVEAQLLHRLRQVLKLNIGTS